MLVNVHKVFQGCVMASLAHAIMTNVYPELSYEQSWDNTNYSMNNSMGLRGTVSFNSYFCVGAIRNEKMNRHMDAGHIQTFVRDFPQKVIETAYRETLQYLLVERDGKVQPCITSMFWADENGMYYNDIYDAFREDIHLFEAILCPQDQAVLMWKEYYDMPLQSVCLLKHLCHEKQKDFGKSIVLGQKEREMIPGGVLKEECIESFAEMNIYFG